VTLWFTGLSGSGKSTIATALERELLNKHNKAVYILDGDNIRHGLNQDLGFGPTDRVENIRRIGEVCNLFTDAGLIVLAAFVSPYREDRDKVRALLKNDNGRNNFLEIHVQASVETCEGRDPKGLYKKARAGEIPNFTGISAPFEPSLSPEVVLKSGEQAVEECVEILIKYLVDGDRTLNLEGRSVLLGRRTGDTVQKRELDLAVVVLQGVGTHTLRSLGSRSRDNLDARRTDTVLGSHLGVELVDGTTEGDFTELLDHVVGTRARIITKPDLEVLDVVGVLLEDLMSLKDLTVGLLDTLKHLHEVPVTGAGSNHVLGEDLHAVHLRGGVSLGRLVTPNDFILMHCHL